MSRIAFGATLIYWSGAGMYRPQGNTLVYVGDRVCDIGPDCIYLADPFDLLRLA